MKVIVTLLGTMLVATFGVAVAASVELDPQVSHMVSLVEELAEVDDCSFECHFCYPIEEHEVEEGVGYKSIHVESCTLSGDCTDHFCWDEGIGGDDQEEQVASQKGTVEKLETLIGEIRSASGATLRSLLRADDDHLAYNQQRGALQVSLCPGIITASIVLDSDQRLAVAAEWGSRGTSQGSSF